MFHGFYNLASGIISQNRNLDVISNNMTNISTAGYKKDTYVSSTFREELLYRNGNKNKNQTAIGTTSMIRSSVETDTLFEQGALNQTDSNLDFALTKPGFFQIQTQDGFVYTRNGSFTVDEEGYLALPGVGRVVGNEGLIQLNSDNINVDAQGTIYDNVTNQALGTIQTVDFQEYDQLRKTDGGMFTTDEQGAAVNGGILWKTLERANTNPIQEMTDMMRSQKAIQSAAQVLKIYDQLMAKATTEIARI